MPQTQQLLCYFLYFLSFEGFPHKTTRSSLDSIRFFYLRFNILKRVKKQKMAHLTSLDELFYTEDNFGAYRQEFQTVFELQVPCIPCLGFFCVHSSFLISTAIIQHDVTFVELIPTKVPITELDNLQMVNFNKMRQIGDILLKVKTCQKRAYLGIASVQPIQQALKNAQVWPEMVLERCSSLHMSNSYCRWSLACQKRKAAS